MTCKCNCESSCRIDPIDMEKPSDTIEDVRYIASNVLIATADILEIFANFVRGQK